MPAQEVAFLFDTAVVWEKAGVDRDGEVTVLTPYEIYVRWESGPSTKVLNQTGQLVRADASIQVEEDYPLGSIFWLGLIEDLPTNVADYTDLYVAVSTDDTADIRGVSVEKHYNLLRFHNTLPEIVGTG